MTEKEQLYYLINGVLDGSYQVSRKSPLLPYDENFHITADGKEIQPERVNTAFLGVRIPEGNHQVKIWYEAAGSRAGLLLSGVAVVVGGIGIFLRTTGQRRKA